MRWWAHEGRTARVREINLRSRWTFYVVVRTINFRLRETFLLSGPFHVIKDLKIKIILDC